MNAIEVSGVHKAFGKLKVLQGVDLTVPEGEIYTLLGENGAGKSTLIDLLVGLTTPDAGRIQVMGLDPKTSGKQVRQQISLNAQNETLDAELSGVQNLRLVATLRGVPNPKAAIAELAAKLDLAGFLTRKVRTYSGGMKRRLDLAMSLLGAPKLIMLDEPTTGVDPQNRLALWDMIRGMKAAGQTVLLTTQYLEEADALADHIAFLKGGRIVKSGTPDEIKQGVHDRYTIAVPKNDRAKAHAVFAAASVDVEGDGPYSVTKAAGPKALAALLEAKVPVAQYDLAQATLEDVYLAVTKREAS